MDDLLWKALFALQQKWESEAGKLRQDKPNIQVEFANLRRASALMDCAHELSQTLSDWRYDRMREIANDIKGG